MEKIKINSNFKFTFDNDAQLSNEERSGYIESYDIVRICVKRLDNGNQVDYPIKTREDYMKTVSRLNEKSNEYDMIEIYQDTHMFDIQDYI
jgi:cell division septal protein FtsQ